MHVGPIVTSDVFYDPDTSHMDRWRARGHLGVEMESAVLFTIAALRSIQAVTLLTVSDLLLGGEPQRISDDELRVGVDRMVDLACRVAVS